MKPSQILRTLNRIAKRGDESWNDWILVGQSLTERRSIAAAKAGARRGTNYAAALQKQLGEELYERFKKLSDNGTIAWLDKCLANLPEIEAWRKRQDDDLKSSNPRNVYQAWAESQRSDIDWQDKVDDLDELHIAQPQPKAGFGHNRQKDLLAEIDRLNERLSQQQMSTYPFHNADRIYRNIVEVVGPCPEAAILSRDTARQLEAIAKRMLGDDDFDLTD